MDVVGNVDEWVFEPFFPSFFRSNSAYPRLWQRLIDGTEGRPIPLNSESYFNFMKPETAKVSVFYAFANINGVAVR